MPPPACQSELRLLLLCLCMLQGSVMAVNDPLCLLRQRNLLMPLLQTLSGLHSGTSFSIEVIEHAYLSVNCQTTQKTQVYNKLLQCYWTDVKEHAHQWRMQTSEEG
jgi:hypothetical protein